MAARHGDGQLAMDMFYAMENWSYTPCASAFNAVIQALVLSHNDIAMFKALNVRAPLVWGLAGERRPQKAHRQSLHFKYDGAPRPN